MRENATQIFGDADRQLMAVPGHGAMFNASPLFAPKVRQRLWFYGVTPWFLPEETSFVGEKNGRQLLSCAPGVE